MNLTVILFGLIAILAVIGTVQALKEKNVLSIIFNAAAALVFGFFVIATVIHQGYPPTL